MSIIRKNPAAAGLSDPSLVRKAEATLAQDVLLTKGRAGVVNGAVVLTSTTLTTTSNSFTTTTSANNQSADTVTVYNTAGAVYVSSIDQTVRQNIVNNPVAGVSKIIAGNNITITSTNGDGTGNVTVNVSGLGNIATTNYDGNASNVLHGDGTWSADTTTYGNSNVVTLLSAFGSNTITTTGNISGGNINISNGYANVTGTANTVGGGATVGVRSILAIDSAFGSNNANDPASAQAVRGRVTGNNLTKTRNYVTGVTGQYLVTGTNASEFIKAGVLGVVGDQTTTADGAVVAYLDGDGGLTTAGSAYGVSMKNSTPGSGFDYGLDLQFIDLNVAGTTTPFKQADIRFNNGVELVANTANNISINANVTVGNITANNLGNISSINIDGSNSNVLYGNGVFAAVAGGANTGNVTFNDINVIGTGNLKLQPDSANASAYLDIFLTAGPDIHIAGNGETVILGTDDYANVAVNVNGNVSIQANAGTPHTWNFGTDGTTTFPTANVDLHNGGVQTGQVLQFGNSSQQAIITGPTPEANFAAERLIIQGQRGNGTGEGGDVYVWGGDADTNGGDIKIYAGDADNVSAGSGGYVNLAGGDGFDNGGDIDIIGGSSANGTGGDIFIDGGSGELDGGNVSIQAGYGVTGQGGTVQITGGAGTSQATYGNVGIGSGTYAWLFDNTGNLTLPGNTFAVNYANGDQVSIGGGGNTGNVTFDDNIIMGTGDEFGGDGLFLAPGNGSIANSAVQYLRVRGGDFPTHIHLDTGNNQYYDQYFGADGRYVKLEANGNVVINADDYLGNSATWTLDTTGNLTLAGGNSVIQSIANSSLDPVNPNVSTMVLTPDPGYSTQSLVLDPTAPGHIHLRAPGANIDEPSANIFLGGEESSFEVGYYNGSAPNLFIHSNNNTWMFDIDGNITFPRDGSNISTDPYLKILGGPSPQILSEDASLAGPANLAIVTNYLNLSGSTGEKIAFHADDGLIATDYDMVLTTNVGGGNTYTWTFGTNGNLTLPEGGIVTNNIPSVTFDILYQYDDLVWSGNTLTFTNASSGYMLQVLALMQIGDIITLNSTPTTVTGTYTGGGAGTFTVSGTGSGQQIITFTLPNRLTSVNGVTLTTNSKNYLFTEAGVTQSPVLTVDALPAGVYAAAGFRAFVSDANLVPVGNFGAIVGNSGSNTVCVWCDGTNWRIG